MSRSRFVSMWLPALVAGIIAIPVVWMMDDSLPRIISKFIPINSPVTPGEPLVMETEGYSVRECTAEISETISDGKRIITRLETREVDRPIGYFFERRGVPTSPTSAPGLSKYMLRACYSCNPLQRWFPLCVEREVYFEFSPSPISQLFDRSGGFASSVP